jgi:hypothetical protein
MLRLARCVLLLALVLAVGCSSEEDDQSGPYAPPGNGVAIGASQACEALRAAHVAQHNALTCGLITLPVCDGYISNQKPCAQYDQGTVHGCQEYIKNRESCEEVAGWRCVLKPIGC